MRALRQALIVAALALPSACSDGPSGSDGDVGVDVSTDVVADDGVSQDGSAQDGSLGDGVDGDAADVADAAVPPSPIRVMTYNVLCSFCDPTNYDPWEERLAYFSDVFERHAPDLVGLQELATPAEVDALVQAVGGDLWQPIFFDEPTEFPYPDSTLLVRLERFDVLDSGTFWLSPTPDDPMSTGFAERQLPRNVTWAIVRDRMTGEPGTEYLFSTTHFDNNSPSQDLSAPLWRERLAALADGRTVIATGDFNSQPSDPAYAGLLADEPAPDMQLVDTWEISASHEEPGTGEGEPPQFSGDDRIDHIIVSADAFDVVAWSLDRVRYGELERFPSDHPAVSAELVVR